MSESHSHTSSDATTASTDSKASSSSSSEKPAKGECPFCAYQRAGPCGAEYAVFDVMCVQPKLEDMPTGCRQAFNDMRACYESQREYYQPILNILDEVTADEEMKENVAQVQMTIATDAPAPVPVSSAVVTATDGSSSPAPAAPAVHIHGSRPASPEHASTTASSTPASSPASSRAPSPAPSEGAAAGKAEEVPAPVEGEAKEPPKECPICAYMRAGPCGAEYTDFDKVCVKRTSEAMPPECGQIFQAMRECFMKHPEYYRPIMEKLDDDRAERQQAREQAASGAAAGPSGGAGASAAAESDWESDGEEFEYYYEERSVVSDESDADADDESAMQRPRTAAGAVPSYGFIVASDSENEA